ncbi:MAG: hypothetical protein ACNYPF_01275 [Candidatus Puniceispirillales bacterium WSBS_2018_MAG_OTU23]
MGKKFKKPKIGTAEKFNAGSEVTNYDQNNPIFCLSNIPENCSDYGMKDVDKMKKAIFLDALYKRSQLTWNQIITNSRTNLGCEFIELTQIKARLSKNFDGENFMIFRTKGSTKSRIIGYRINDVFHIVAYDHKGKSYSH